MKEKMSFEEFKSVVADGIKKWLPDFLQNAEIRLHVVNKNNDVKLTGLTIQAVDNNIAPTIYLESYYEKYASGVAEMEEIMKRIADVRVEHEVRDKFDLSGITDIDKCRNKILPKLVAADWNVDLLTACPHVLIEDLAVIFYIDLGTDGEGLMSITIKDDLFKIWDVTTDELYDIAVSNLSDQKLGTFTPMSELMRELMLPNLLKEVGNDMDVAEEMLSAMVPDDDMMFVLSVKSNLNGASILLDKQMMQSVVEKIGDDFFILPSSVHECILVPARAGMDSFELKSMVESVNSTEVAKEERLSDNVYRYSLEDGIRLA